MKKILFLTLLLAGTLTAQAQTARNVMDRVAAKLDLHFRYWPTLRQLIRMDASNASH